MLTPDQGTVFGSRQEREGECRLRDCDAYDMCGSVDVLFVAPCVVVCMPHGSERQVQVSVHTGAHCVLLQGLQA